MLAPDETPIWLRLIMDLVVGAGAGALGAVARELGRIDREFTWLLLPMTVGGMALGAGIYVATSAFGITNDHARFAIAFFCGTLGQAYITDLIRGWLRSMLPPHLQAPQDARASAREAPPASGTPPAPPDAR